MGIDGGDVNGDGLIDYMMTNFSEEKDTLYLAEGDGFFLDASARSGLGPLTFRPLGFGLGFLDHDLDGDLDVFIARGHILDNITEVSPGTTLSYRQPDQLLENDGSGRFTDVSSGAGAWFREAHVGRAAAFADYDNDGDVDVVVVNTEWRAVLLRNDRPRTARWLGLGLRGNGPSNRDATGSLIRVKLRGRDAVAPLEARTAWSYQAACDPRRIVGLGRDGDVEHVTVRWPDGLVEVFRDVNPEAYNELVRGTGQ